MIVAVVGPKWAGKTMLATSLAVYLYLATPRTVFVDLSYDKLGAQLVRRYLPAAKSISEAKSARFVVVDTPPLEGATPEEVLEADKYVLVSEKPVDVKSANVAVVLNKAQRRWLWGRKLVVPFDDSIKCAMDSGYPPIMVQNVRSWRRLAEVVRAIADPLLGP